MLSPNTCFEISKHKIVCKYDTILTIDTKQYETSKSLVETSTHFIIPGVISTYIPEFSDTCNFIVNYNVKVIKPPNIINEKNIYELYYSPNDVIIEQDSYIDELNMSLLTKLFEGRAQYINTPEELYNLILQHLNTVDSVHIELIMSNMFRCAEDLHTKCRHKSYKNSQIIGQTAQPFIDSWLSSIAFQRIDVGIRNALIDKNDAVMNPIELVLNEQFDNIESINT